MRLIKTKEQLIKNIETIEKYLTEGSEAEKSETYELIRKGRCLIAYQVDKEIRFAPSRFLGYIDNTLDNHDRKQADGKETNVIINNILKSKSLPNDELRNKYFLFCQNFRLKPDNHNHKFWNILELENDFLPNLELTGEFPEGKIIERTHKARERNSQVIQLAKDNFKKKHGKLYCQVCDFDFEKVYGEIGEHFIEGHHIIAVSEMTPDHKTKPEDIAMLCANCHRMIHKKRPWLTMKELKKLLKGINPPNNA